MCAMMHTQRSENNFTVSQFSPSTIWVLGLIIQIIRLGSRHLYLLIHLVNQGTISQLFFVSPGPSTQQVFSNYLLSRHLEMLSS